MSDTTEPRTTLAQIRSLNGLGVACAEAQADGVPCPGADCDCEECGRGEGLGKSEP